MNSQENSTGRPLADTDWLESHHKAKLPERMSFAKRLASLNPKSIVDLGCATGLWLEIMNECLPSDCSFIGIDSDGKSLDEAAQRSDSWDRDVRFLHLDIEKNANKIPSADLTLAFNVFPYIVDLETFIEVLARRTPCGTLAVRQYDGASIRFGPMLTSKRQEMESDLRVSTEHSQHFKHYDMDRVYQTLRNSSYEQASYEFELFERTSPFPSDFIAYYEGTLSWTSQFLSDRSSDYFQTWISNPHFEDRYFYEVDLVALLS